MTARNQKTKRRFWRVARRVFRWCRIVVWTFVLLVLIALIWMHHHGLPDFAKEQLVNALAERGMQVQFSRMRLVWYRGIVADNLQFGQAGRTNGPRASATEAEVHLRLRSLLQAQVEIEGVELRGGRMSVPVWGTNDAPEQLDVEKINGELKFLPGDEWDLSRFQAEAFGVGLRISGRVTNALAMRGWKFARPRPKEKTPQAFWQNLLTEFKQTQFAPESEISGTISGDAERIESFRANLSVRSPLIASPWGTGSNLLMSAKVTPQSDALLHAELHLRAENADTRWGRAANLQLEANVTPSLTQWTPTNAHVHLQVKRARTPWGSASALAVKADFRPNPSDPTSALVDYWLRGQQVQTPWVRVAQGELRASGVVSASNAWPSVVKAKADFAGGEIAPGRAASGTIEASLTLPSWADVQLGNTNVSWWTRLDSVAGDLTAELASVRTPQVEATNLTVAASWKSPLLSITELSAGTTNGGIRGAVQLDTVTRGLSAEVKTDLDPKNLAHLLSTNALRWMTQFDWERAPKATASLRAILPPWTNATAWKAVNWREDVMPTVGLAGHFEVGAGGYRGIKVTSAVSDFSYTNRTWHLPNLTVTRPGERAHINHVSNEKTLEFKFLIDSVVDPRLLAPVLDPTVREVLSEFEIAAPPVVHAELAGVWHAPERITARVELAATNLSYRAKPVLWCRSLVTYTNQVLTFVSPEVGRKEGTSRAESVVVDIGREQVRINNATGVMEVAALTRVINPTVERTMEPYRFIDAPRAWAHGVIDFHDPFKCDLRFKMAGGKFEWRSFRFQQITGDIHWGGSTLNFSNVVGSMYGGRAEMSAAFNFDVRDGADFAFRTLVSDLNFHAFMNDMWTPTNKLEGTLNGLLVITNANTHLTNSWFGYGNVSLTDGLIWEVPVFGLFSPMLNAIKPGSGNNRAREVTGTFIITNSVISSDDLMIHASGMRLNFDGTVGFDARLNGRAEAQLFRNTPGVGQVVSTVLWPVTKLFEYRVSGTLGKPKSQPVYIPKIFMAPFHPLRSLRELMDNDKDEPLPKVP